MKKKILILLFAFFISFGFMIETSAKSCTYLSNDENRTGSFKLKWAGGYEKPTIEDVNITDISTLIPKNESINTSSDKTSESCKEYATVCYNGRAKASVYFYDTLEDAKNPKTNVVQNSYHGVDTSEPCGNKIIFEKEKQIDNPEQEETSSCAELQDKTSCENDRYFSCVWNEYSDEFKRKTGKEGYCNTDKLQYVSCGGAFDIPSQVPELTSFVVNLLKIATPIILIVVSVISLLKALAASKEDDIKKAQSSLVRRIIAAAIVFFIVSIVQFVISKVADGEDQSGVRTCANCFLNNNCEVDTYYKTYVGSTTICTKLDGSSIDCKDNSSD